MSGCCCSAGVDYTDPRSLPGGGMVQFNPALGPLSTSLSIPLLLDNITECTEYFALSFVAITNGDELGIMAVEPTMAIVAIKDTNGECSLPGVWCVLYSVSIKHFLLGNICIVCIVTQWLRVLSHLFFKAEIAWNDPFKNMYAKEIEIALVYSVLKLIEL